MNGVVGPSFKVIFVEKNIYVFREQCTGTTKNAKRMH